MPELNLGPLEKYRTAIIDRANPAACQMALVSILKRMAQIEADSVSKSSYRELKPGEQDEVPTGDTYNELFDAVLDEIRDITE
jgi:hypothetical protein